MIAGHPTHAPQTHRLHHEALDQEPRHTHEAHGLVCRPDRIEGQDVPARGLRDPHTSD